MIVVYGKKVLKPPGDLINLIVVYGKKVLKPPGDFINLIIDRINQVDQSMREN